MDKYKVIPSTAGRFISIARSVTEGLYQGFNNTIEYNLHCNELADSMTEDGAVELTVFSQEDIPVAYLMLNCGYSYHYEGLGLVVDVVAIDNTRDDQKSIAQVVTKLINEVAIDMGAKWYERTKHITKDITQSTTKRIKHNG